jgi:hypothetical protein
MYGLSPGSPCYIENMINFQIWLRWRRWSN